jgi:hypothetical protein
MVKAARKLATKVGKSINSTSSASSTMNAECSPPFKRNSAKSTLEPILSSSEQTAYKKYSTEVKQIAGLIILSCGLGVAEKKTCSQIMQEEEFFSTFDKVYEKLSQDVLVGKRVATIPLKVGTSTAKEVLSGKKLRKKYSAMKSYMNNTLSPLWRK